MSALTDLQAAIGKAVITLKDIKDFAEGGTYTGHRTNWLGAGTADAQPGPQQVLAQLHAALYGLQRFGQPAILSFVSALGRVQGYPETDGVAILRRFFDDAQAAPYTVKSRNITFGSFSAGGSNVGNGTVTRLTKDYGGYPIENCAMEAKSITCVRDEHSGAQRWAEEFTLRGASVSQVVWPYPGAGKTGTARALSIRDSESVGVRNPGFETYDSTNGFSGWSAVTSMANFTQDTTRYYKDVLPASTPAAAIQAAGTTDYLYQPFSTNGIRWDPNVPLYAQVAYMRRSSATGTLVLQIGDTQVTVDISTKTNDQWNVLRFPAATPTSGAWFKNWNNSNPGTSSNPFVKVGVTSLATGTCLLDDLIVAPYTNFDGAWVAIVPGPTNSATTAGPAVPFLRDDVFTATDSSGATAIIQEALALYLNYYLPSVTDASQTWAEPT